MRKIKEACDKYAGPLPEYDINEAGIMVLSKACDKYMNLLGHSDQDNDQDNNQDRLTNG